MGRKHVGTLMGRMGIEALYRVRGTSKKHPGHEIYPYLLRAYAINRANRLGTGHALHPDGQRLRLPSAVVDWASRHVLAAKVAITLEACHAVDVLQDALIATLGRGSVEMTTAASSPPMSSCRQSRSRVANPAWMGAGPGEIMCLSSACGNR